MNSIIQTEYPLKKPDSKNIAVLDAGDFHFGAGNDEKLAQEYEKFFNDNIKSNASEIDLIVISGDLFHKELKMSSDSMRLLLKCFTRTVKLCETYKIPIRLLQGTLTHDRGQVETLSVMLNSSPAFKAITTCTVEEIYPGIKVLYIPEEYPKDMKEFYKEAIFEAPDKAYDMIFFHGTIDFQAFASQAYESEMAIETAPVFKSEDLIRICKGPISGGHIHTACNYKKKIYYHGSFSRTSQGEPKAKGFNVIVYNKETNKFVVDFEENTDAPVFKTVAVDDLFIGSGSNLETFIKTLEATAADKDVNYRFTISEDLASENPSLKKVISDFANDSHNVTMQIKRANEVVFSEETQEMVSEEQAKDELAFLADPSLDYSEKIQKFCSVKLGKDIDLDKIRLIISGEK